MKVRLLATAAVLSLGLASGAIAQGMQPQPGMDPGMGDDMSQGAMGRDSTGMEERPMKRTSKKKMKSNKAGKRSMRSQPRMKNGGREDGGMESGADDGM